MQLLKPDNGQSTSAQSTLTPAQESRSNYMEILDYTAPHNAPPSVSRFEECRSLSDTATQCCFDPIILVSVATQTDDAPTTVASDDSSDGSSLDKTQASFTVPVKEWKISHDHTYSMSVPMVYPTYGLDEDSLASYTEIEVDPPVENNIDTDFNEKEVYDNDFDDEYEDPNWNLPNAKKILLSNGNDSSEGESEGELEPPDTDKKYLVFGNCLDQLLKHCPKCGVVVTGQKKKTTGSMLSVEMICLDGHITYWDSQPIIKRKPVGNLLLAASILFTGNTFAGVSRLASCLNSQFISESVFYDTQQRFLFPVLNQAWANEQQMVRQELSNKSVIHLNGDGRCDSPGHNAKYGTYSLTN